MGSVANAILDIRAALRPETRLVAVSKFHPEEEIQEAYDAGQRIFGESKVQEIARKHPLLPSDIQWHFIGHLQTNKVKQLVPLVSLIQSVDSERLLKEINKEAVKCDRIVNCLLQIHIAQEEEKFGFSSAEALAFLQEGAWREMSNIRICGVMGMATFTESRTIIEAEFASLKLLFDQIKSNFFAVETSFCELSMGMSEDYPIAIAHGSTLVRVGSKIFGVRDY